jgi:hypothetical protein
MNFHAGFVPDPDAVSVAANFDPAVDEVEGQLVGRGCGARRAVKQASRGIQQSLAIDHEIKKETGHGRHHPRCEVSQQRRPHELWPDQALLSSNALSLESVRPEASPAGRPLLEFREISNCATAGVAALARSGR